MANFNKVILAGNLTRDPELRYTPKGMAIAKVGLAINRKWKSETGEMKEEATFVDVDAFGKTAETIGQYLKKGRPILIEGRLRYQTWEDKQSGQKKSKLGVVMETFQFLDSGGAARRRRLRSPGSASGGCIRARARRRRCRGPPQRRRSILICPFHASRFNDLTLTIYIKTEVILTHNIVGLGGESDQVKVAAGYARNYLFPQRLAVPLTQTNKRQIESLRQRRAEREAHEFNTMSELAKGVSKLTCIIKVKAGEDGKMFGSVTAGMIADELKHQFDIALDKRKIHLEHPLRSTGEYEIELNLHAEVKGTLKVRIESLTPAPAPTPEALAAADTKAEKPRTKSALMQNATPKSKSLKKPKPPARRNRTRPKPKSRPKPPRLRRPRRRKRPNKFQSQVFTKPRKIFRGFFVA